MAFPGERTMTEDSVKAVFVAFQEAVKYGAQKLSGTQDNGYG